MAVFSRRSPGFHPDPEDIACTHTERFKLVHGKFWEVRSPDDVCRHEAEDVHAALKEAMECAGIAGDLDEENLTVAAHSLDASSVVVISRIGFVKDDR